MQASSPKVVPPGRSGLVMSVSVSSTSHRARAAFVDPEGGSACGTAWCGHLGVPLRVTAP
jgi:hypothetical protein